MEKKDLSTLKKEQELLDIIYEEKKYIFEIYSLYEMKQLFYFCEYDQTKLFYYFDNFTKEENLEKIYEKNREMQRLKEKECKKIKIKLEKERIIVFSKCMNELKKLNNNEKRNEIYEMENVWKYLLSQNINLIDLRDALNSFDKHSLFEKVKNEIKLKTKKGEKMDKMMVNLLLSNELEKTLEKKESKIINLYLNNFEENDKFYLKKIERWDEFKKYSIEAKTNPVNSINFYTNFINLPQNMKFIIFDLLDIFTVGRLGLCNKELYKIIFKEYNISINNAKVYVSAIFVNSKLYEIDKSKIKSTYKNNFLNMFKNKSRIKFTGIYYSRVKMIREFFKYGSENTNTFQIYYRILKFFPNGLVYSITTPNYKINKIKKSIKENQVEFKMGHFYISKDDTINIKYTNNDEYIYKLGWSTFSLIRFGCDLNDPGIKDGIELISYTMKDKFGDKLNIKLDENFPKRFRFRKIHFLENDVFLKKEFYFE